jgi:hypothetical protein
VSLVLIINTVSMPYSLMYLASGETIIINYHTQNCASFSID